MRLALLGDIALFGRLSYRNSDDINYYFEDVANLLGTMDYVVGNLETPFSVKKKTHGAKSAYICSDVENVDILKSLHINAVSLANNHMFDYGKEGYETTKKVLNDSGISWFGAEGKDLNIDIMGNKLAFLGFCCYSTNPLKCVPYGDYGINEYDIPIVESLEVSYSKKGYLPILAIHNGIEHVNYPSIDSINAARHFADIAPCVFYGHHPHVVQGIERRGDSLIAYSLGNFCFDDVYTSVSKEPLISLSENNRSSCILVVTIEKSKIVSYETIPIYIGRDKMTLGQGATPEIITKYTDAIYEMNEDDYQRMRSSKLADYISTRKAKRDLMWYIKRLRLRYLRIIINSRNSKINYKRCVSQHINN